MLMVGKGRGGGGGRGCRSQSFAHLDEHADAILVRVVLYVQTWCEHATREGIPPGRKGTHNDF